MPTLGQIYLFILSVGLRTNQNQVSHHTIKSNKVINRLKEKRERELLPIANNQKISSFPVLFPHIFPHFPEKTTKIPETPKHSPPSMPSPLGSPTSSRSVTQTVNGSHRFTIKGYSLAKGMGVGKNIASESFTVGGYQWAIYFYPDGKNPEDNSTYVSVFVALASEGTDVRALFELTLLDQSGKGKHKVHSHFDRALESGPYSLKYRGSMW